MTNRILNFSDGFTSATAPDSIDAAFTTTTSVIYVAKNGLNTNTGGILNPLLTISAAITAATSGTTIYVAPGNYVENITLKAGVSIAGQQSRNCFITGNVVADYNGTVYLHSLDFRASTGVVLTISGVTAPNLQLDDCHIDSLSGASHAINYTNVNSASKFLNESGAVTVAVSTSARAFSSNSSTQGTVIFQNISARLLDNKSNICLFLEGYVVFTHMLDDIHGSIYVSNSASYNGVNLTIDSGSSAMIDVSSLTLSTLANIVCLSTANPVVTGVGYFAHGIIGFASTGEGFAPTLNINTGAAPIPTSSFQLHPEANTTLPYDGQINYNGTHAYITIGSTRYQIDQQVPVSLKTATTTVSIGSATAPTAGQVLTASSGTAASWATFTTSKNDTYANLVTWASTAIDSSLAFSTDTKLLYYVTTGILQEVAVMKTISGTVTSLQVSVGITAVRAISTGTAPNANRKRLMITPLTIVGSIFIGGSTVSTSNGKPIIGPDTIFLDWDASDYYLVSDVAGNVVSIVEVI